MKIVEVTKTARKSEEGASITVKWTAMKPDDKYEVKFVTDIKGGFHHDEAISVSVKGVEQTEYTVVNLMHDMLYRITVCVVDRPESESQAVMVRTPKAVRCKFISPLHLFFVKI